MAEKRGEGLSERKKLILKAIVEAHIQGGEPVGSGNPTATNYGELRIRTVPLQFTVTYDVNANPYGGTGTAPYTAAGAALILLGSGMLARRKRRTLKERGRC